MTLADNDSISCCVLRWVEMNRVTKTEDPKVTNAQTGMRIAVHSHVDDDKNIVFDVMNLTLAKFILCKSAYTHHAFAAPMSLKEAFKNGTGLRLPAGTTDVDLCGDTRLSFKVLDRNSKEVPREEVLESLIADKIEDAESLLGKANGTLLIIRDKNDDLIPGLLFQRSSNDNLKAEIRVCVVPFHRTGCVTYGQISEVGWKDIYISTYFEDHPILDMTGISSMLHENVFMERTMNMLTLPFAEGRCYSDACVAHPEEEAAPVLGVSGGSGKRRGAGGVGKAGAGASPNVMSSRSKETFVEIDKRSCAKHVMRRGFCEFIKSPKFELLAKSIGYGPASAAFDLDKIMQQYVQRVIKKDNDKTWRMLFEIVAGDESSDETVTLTPDRAIQMIVDKYLTDLLKKRQEDPPAGGGPSADAKKKQEQEQEQQDAPGHDVEMAEMDEDEQDSDQNS